MICAKLFIYSNLIYIRLHKITTKKKQNKMKELELKLTVEEINAVLTSLGNMPFIKVNDLIHKIQEQSNEQLAAENPNQTKLPLEETKSQ